MEDDVDVDGIVEMKIEMARLEIPNGKYWKSENSQPFSAFLVMRKCESASGGGSFLKCWVHAALKDMKDEKSLP